MDPVEQARIALLQLHTSQMQAYKIYALTLLAGFFGVLQTLGTLGFAPTLSTTLVWLAGGVVAGGLFFCLGRFMWYGAMVSSTVCTSFTEADLQGAAPLMAQLQRRISSSAYEGWKAKGPARWMIRLGFNRLQLIAWWLGILLFFILIRLLGMMLA
jgi:hypothetical protein